ncbi:uncharacterized protein AB675_145 [Cyphellophora attinorum]|uniref:Uncharacterized protein n=1 Tax=Cyphellophora attinorum TaxID=1664694 RepID=A0A0N0NK42_9EURO|nr:uncharacterized protein AB675_145 [Phialophora attinorum]KPI37711.1 hypothetical protein AB675_145 [Phialophora attinorum]
MMQDEKHMYGLGPDMPPMPPMFHPEAESTWVDVRNFHLPPQAPAGYMSQPPPYDPMGLAGWTANRGSRPKDRWRVQVEDAFDLEPWGPLKMVKWCLHDETTVGYELNMRPLGGFRKKFGWYQGSANYPPGKQPAVTYTPGSGTIKSADGGLEIKCNYQVDRSRNQQFMPFRLGNLNFRWASDRVQSTVDGRLWDETQNTLLDQLDQPLATVRWLYPDGRFDGSMQPTMACQAVYLYHQWDTMNKEVRNTSYRQRVPTYQAVEARFSRGRMITYCYLNMAELEKARDKLQKNLAREASRVSSGGGSTGTTAVAPLATTC